MEAKRKRGRPRRPSFPAPRTVSEGVAIALYGSVGACDAFPLLYPEWPLISSAAGTRIKTFIQERGGSGIEELAHVAAALSAPAPIADRRRGLTILCRIGCEAVGAPFSIPTLRVWLQRRGLGETSPSTLSKLVKWAGSAKNDYPYRLHFAAHD